MRNIDAQMWLESEYDQAVNPQDYRSSVVATVECSGFVETKIKQLAANLVTNIDDAMLYVERTGNTERLDAALKAVKTMGYTIAATRGAVAGATIGSVIPGAGSAAGALVGVVGGIAQQYAIDTVTDEVLHLSSNALQSQFPSLTNREAESLALATMLTAGSTKAAKDYLQKSLVKVKVHVGDDHAFAGAATEIKPHVPNAHAAEDALRSGTFSYEQKLHPGRKMEEHLKDSYGSSEVTSSTLPSSNSKNVKLAGQRHPVSDIVYDTKGFPVFDDHALYDMKLPVDLSSINKPDLHKRAATRDLRTQIETGKINKNIFSEQQIQDINGGKDTIYGYIWHHHQDTGRMQLIPEKLHKQTGHIGSMSLQFKQNNN